LNYETTVVDFVIVIDDLRKEGKIKISPISREANSFDCPKCGSLLSPENPDSYSEFGDEEHEGALIQCKRCNARIKLLWRTDPSPSICKLFKKPK
jgi:transcription elongation factor Elf1